MSIKGERQFSVADALAAVKGATTIAGAARALGCSRKTLYRRGEECPEVAAAMALRLGGGGTSVDLQDPQVQVALAALCDVAENSEKDAARVAAAKVLLEYLGRAAVATPERDVTHRDVKPDNAAPVINLEAAKAKLAL